MDSAMTAVPVVLASTSVWRRELLSRILADFQIASPDVDEQAYHKDGDSPAELAVRLAQRKALAVAEKHNDSIVIGSDQVVDLHGSILGKPETTDNAIAQLQSMQGQTHRLITAVCVISPQKTVEFSDTTTLTMLPLTKSEISRYVDRDQPLQCAGSYMIESAGIALFESVTTSDFTAITGLPLIQLGQVLRDLGVKLF
jgi:septum formation protein